MNRTRRQARALQLAALGLAVGACYTLTVSLTYTAALVTAAVGSDLAGHHLKHRARREQAIAQRLTNLRRDEPPGPPLPCCPLWQHSHGQAHGPGCTRPPAARYDGPRLTARERAAFEQITRRYDHGTAA